MQRKQVQMGVKELKLINALIYGVVRTGGTETTPEELANTIPFNDFNHIVEDVMGLFNDSYFEESDLKKLKDNGTKNNKPVYKPVPQRYALGLLFVYWFDCFALAT